MAKKLLKQKKPRRGLFDTFEHVKNVKKGETLRFRDTNGRLTKFDGRKKLIAEIWLGNKRTNRVLNKTSRKQPVAKKFPTKFIKKTQLASKVAKQGPRVAAELNSKRFTIDAHQTIAANIEAKCPEVGNDTVKFSKRGNGAYITIALTLKDENGELFYESIQMVSREFNRQKVYDEIARVIIGRLYSNEMRASSIKMSTHMGRRGRYVRSIKTFITWTETKKL